MLLGFGLYTYRTDPTAKMHQSGQQKGSLWYNTWTAFLVTFSNPLIIFLFLALYAQFAFVLPSLPFEMLVGCASVVGGALLWWWGLTWLVDKIRTKFDTNGIRIINQVIGVVVILCSLIMLLGTTTNLVRF
jgi:threonine/homoserine/homoserine lactone efflux protein